jgi:hypothetical protein
MHLKISTSVGDAIAAGPFSLGACSGRRIGALGQTIGEVADAPTELAVADLDGARHFFGAIESTPMGERDAPEGGRRLSVQDATPAKVSGEIIQGHDCRPVFQGSP